MIEGISIIHRIIKSFHSRALIVRINLAFLALFVVIYATQSFFYHENAASIVRCSFTACHHHKDEIYGVRVKAVLEEAHDDSKLEVPRLLRKVLGKEKRNKKKIVIGMVNMDEDIVRQWNYKKTKELSSSSSVEAKAVRFTRVSESFKWEDLFPEWIDEEEESEVPTCPEIPMPDFDRYGKVDVVVAELPCNGTVRRDVFWLQVHLIAAKLAVKKRVEKVVFWSKCRPMMEIFRCSEMVKRDGDWWLFRPEIGRLAHKLALPVGSCQLSLPLWGKGIDEVYDISKLPTTTATTKREAYATVLHSSEIYVCGAIALAQSLRRTGTTRDLVLLHDSSISRHNLAALSASGWLLRLITRIRNPHAQPGTYNEYNYSKLRLWQLSDSYRKLVFVDSDILVLRNLDVLFRFPEITAAGNDFSIFNSGVMVVEPSNCTFKALKERISDVVSYNGGDQGFLNEMFVWWHRVPRRVNYLKNFWENSTTNEISYRNELFGAEDPPKVYTIHYLGTKPWMCYRDYDCNWDKEESFVYASDVAHRRWWRVYDEMDEQLQRHCRLSKRRRIDLDWDRGVAKKKGLVNGHWMINITDPRRERLVD